MATSLGCLAAVSHSLSAGAVGGGGLMDQSSRKSDCHFLEDIMLQAHKLKSFHMHCLLLLLILKSALAEA